MSGTKVTPSDIPNCPQCGTPLPAGALAGLCPACLLKQGAADETATGGQTPPFHPPSVVELAPLFPQLEILELIGKGGMGAVYKARQKELDRLVALKILPPGIGDDTAFAGRFAREAKALAKLNHPGIVTLYEFGQVQSSTGVSPASGEGENGKAAGATPALLYYFLMEFVDGVNLRQLLHAGRIAPREALAIVPQICDALQFAHDQGIVHRDIKPENILLDRRGRVKVADFGLAKLVGAEVAERSAGLRPGVSSEDDPNEPGRRPALQSLTDAGKVMGTPNYMAPEQMEHPNEVDHRADIYALGVVFYQMLTGELPGKRLEPPSSKVQIDVRLDEVVLRALEKDPARRYQQVSEVKTMVETIATTPRASDESAKTTDSPPRVSLCYVSMPEHLRTLQCRLLYNFQAKGELRLDRDTLSFDSGWSVVKIPLSSICALAKGSYPMSFIKLLLMPANYLAVTFTEQGVSRTLLFTPTPPLNTVRTWVRYYLTNPNKKKWENQIVLTEWSDALQEAIRARTGSTLPFGHHSGAKTPSRWNQAISFFIMVAFLAMFIVRPSLNEQLPSTALAVFNSLPDIARFAVWIAISIIAFGLFLVLTNLLTKLAVAVEPLPRKISIQFANSFPPQPTDEKSWLAIVDSGKYAESWEMAADSFQCTISKEEWVAQLEKVRRPLGKVISRKLRSIKLSHKLRSMKHAAVWTRAEQKFNTSFDSLLAAVETSTCAKQPDGSWRITGYHIRPAGWRKYQGRLLLVFPFALLVLLAVFLGLKAHHQISEIDKIVANPLGNNGDRELQSPPFVARLKQGSVELLAIGNQPWSNTICWLPDGRLSSKPFPTGNVSLGGWTMDMVEKKIAFRIHNESSNGPISFPVCRFNKESGISGGSYSMQPPGPRSPDAVFFQTIACPTNARTMNESLGVANGPWETATTLKHENNALGIAGAEGEWSASYNAVIGSSDVAVNCNYNKSEDWETRMVCVDDDGKTTVIPENSTRASTLQTGGILLVSSNEFACIKEFQLQRRKYQWVEFRNVSLQPGHSTPVKVRDAVGEQKHEKLMQNGTATRSDKISNTPGVKTVVLTRATNQLVGASNDVRTVTLWTDSMVQPGETLSALVKLGDGQMIDMSSELFINWEPDEIGTSSAFTWWFGNPSFTPRFGQNEAEAAVAQLRNWSEKPLTLISGNPLELFSVTNKSGEIMVGYLEFKRNVPTPPVDSPAAKVQAIVHIRGFTAFSPTVNYDVKLPPGYALRATANRGRVCTIIAKMPPTIGEYRSDWSDVSLLKPLFLQPGQRPQFQLPPRRMDAFAEGEAQRAVLESQFQALQDQGPIPVFLGEPKLLFSTTNNTGEVYQGFLELVGPPTLTNK